jgi:hypothetical protein
VCVYERERERERITNEGAYVNEMVEAYMGK